MPVDLESSMTFGQLVLETARRCNVAEYINPDDEADNRARIPSDPHDLDEIKSAVNRGYKAFLKADPNWSFNRIWVTLAIGPDAAASNVLGGDAARYRLPNYCRSVPLTNWQYVSGNQTYPYIHTMAYGYVAQQREWESGGSPSSGSPMMAGVRAIETGDGFGRGMEVVFYPTPDRAYTVQAEFIVTPYEMVELAERHVCGSEHDDTIIDAAVYQFKKHDGQPAEIATYAALYDASLKASMRHDAKNRTRNHGPRLPSPGFGDKPCVGLHRGEFPIVQINGVTVNGVTVN